MLTLLAFFFFTTSLHAEKKESIFGTVEEKLYDFAHEFEGVDAAADSKLYQPAPFESSIKDDSYDVLIVTSGGWNSCKPGPYGQPMAPYIRELRQQLYKNRGSKSRLLPTCFPRFGKKIYYYSPSKPKTIHSGEVFDLVNLITIEAQKSKAKEVYLLGFSYGGWLAMQVADKLPTNVKIGELITIDPISMERCRPSDIVAFFYKHVKSKAFKNECQNAPSDISSETRRKILAKVGQWTHFFQSDARHLHSSAMPEVPDNIFIKSKADGTEYVMGHGRLLHDDRVWSIVHDSIVGDAKAR